MPSVLRVTLFLVPICGAFPQPAATLAFDVASVKANTGGNGEGPGHGRPKITTDPVSLSMTNVSLQGAIGWAYHVFPHQVTGPGWLETERYDVAARAGSAVVEADLRLMLRQLLADRFKLAVHRESKEMTAYVVSVGKGGVKFKESSEEGPSEMKPTGRMAISIRKTTMAQIADMLGSAPLPYPVVDQTGLTGRYDITLDLFSVLGGGAAPQGMDDAIPLVIQALGEQLGLKVDQRKTAIDMVIVDHAEKVPTQN